MLGVQVGLAPQYASKRQVQLPVGFGWDQARFPIQVEKSGNGYKSDLDPRALVDPEIWTGAAIHVDATTGNDDNSGLGAFDGDFNDPKRTIYGAFREGNLTGSAYRVIVKPGRYEESAFTRNGNDEPALPVAILGWQGDVQYRTGPFSVNWSDAGGTFSAAVSSVKRAFRTGVQTPQGQYIELTKTPDLATCQATEGTWYLDGGTTHVNVGVEPSADGIALLRGFHGARFLNHSHDIYLENIHCEGGLTNYAIEANAGTVCKRDHVTVAGTEATSVGGEIGPF